MPMSRALVTGSAGFIGRHMTAELRRRGWDVEGVDLVDGRDALDVFRQDSLTDVPHYDLVVHAAARSPHRAAIDGQPASHIYNALLDAAMFDWAVRTRQGRVLFLSSCAVLDAEPDDYGQLKLTGERMARQARRAGISATVVRPFSGYGEDQGPLWPFGAFVARAKRRSDPFLIWGTGEQVRDWLHVDDLVAGALAVVESGTETPVSLCTGVGTSMRELAEMVVAVAGYCPRLAPRPQLPAGTERRVGDPGMMLRYYTPRVSLQEGVRRALAGAGVPHD